MSEATRILVVDDELGIREGCRKILAAEGYDVTTAEDGVCGLDAYRQGSDFAAVIVDLKMPRMGGMEFITQVKSCDPHLLILVITAYASIPTAVETTKSGAYGYICKPFTPDELLLSVKNGLEKRTLALEAQRLREEREKRLLEVAFERSKSNTIINCMTDGVLVVNRSQQIVLRNAAVARMIPACADIPLPFPLKDATDCGDIKNLLLGVLGSPAPVIEFKEITVGKSTYMVNTGQVIETNGEVLGAVAVLRDITALKKLEIAKSMFVSMVAHELKNPIAAVEGYLNLILADMTTDPEQEKKILQRMLVRIQTLRTLITELLSLSAIESGNFSIKRLPTDISGLIAEAVETCKPKAGEKKTELVMRDSSPAIHEQVLVDKEAVRRILINLVDNAIKYTPDHGHVSVSTEKSGMYLKVSVRDSGIGVSAEEQKSIFDEFFRVKNEYTSQVAGTGLGLSLVKRLVEMHQGKITVESAPEKGSTFSVYLPLA